MGSTQKSNEKKLTVLLLCWLFGLFAVHRFYTGKYLTAGLQLLDRTLIYTALTRGVEQVVFIGDRGAFDRAVKASPQSQERMVGFSI